MLGTVMYVWKTSGATSKVTCVIFFTQRLHINLPCIVDTCCTFHVSWKTITMFVGLCCILCHFQCMNLLFPHRLPWTGSPHQTWDTLEHERQVILSQRCLTTMILVISPQLLYRHFLWSHVTWSLLLVFIITDYATVVSFFLTGCHDKVSMPKKYEWKLFKAFHS